MSRMTFEMWMRVGTWWMKKISTAIEQSASAMAMISARWGTKPWAAAPTASGLSSGDWIVLSTMIEKTNVAVKVPSVIWLPRSDRKFVRSRGPYWPEA